MSNFNEDETQSENEADPLVKLFLKKVKYLKKEHKDTLENY